MASTIEEIEAAIQQAISTGFRGRLLDRGLARSMIWSDGILPNGSPNFADELSYDLLSFGYSLLSLGLRLRELNGDADLCRAAFEKAATAITDVVHNGNPNDPEKGFHKVLASSAFHLGRYSAKALAKQSIQDPLTGLLNRRGFMEAVENLGEHKYYSFLIMDLDDFKHVNDTYGHAVGDSVLTNFTTAVKQQIRGKDIFTRLGGEEFGLLIAYDKDNKQVNIFERICACIEMLPHYADDHEFNVTMSGGAITTNSISRVHDIKSIMAQADALLYEAKSAGKNQIKYADFDGSFDILN